MSVTAENRRAFLLRYQSNFILPLARLITLGSTTVSLIGIVGGLLAAIVLFSAGLGGPKSVPVPAIYETPPAKIDLKRIDARLVPPSEVRFIVTRGVIDEPLEEGEALGYFDARTPNELAQFPDDFEILGGEDASRFRRIQQSPTQQRAALAATSALVEQINGLREILSAPDSTEFTIKVAARDSFGTYSAPTDIKFKLSYAPSQPKTPEQARPSPQEAPSSAKLPTVSPLQQLAREIALKLDPGQTTLFFDFYERAQRVPRECRANDDISRFQGVYRLAFEHAKAKLKPKTIEAFYAGLCDSWKQMIAEERVARSDAMAARNAAISTNKSLRLEYAARKLASWSGTRIALAVLAAALAAFLLTAHILAGFAQENHASAMRKLVEAGKVDPVEGAALNHVAQTAEDGKAS